MTIMASRPIPQAASIRLASVGLSVVVAAVLLSGCGGGSPEPRGSVVTVTATPTVTAKAAPPPATPTATATTASVAKSDVVGRKFDLGTITKIETEGGVPVIIFDRWTAQRVQDATLAAKGVPIVVHSDAPYENLNTTITYRIPVVRGAVFTYKHCVAVDQPASQRPSTLQEFAALPDSEKVMLLTLDPKGWVFSAQNDPAC